MSRLPVLVALLLASGAPAQRLSPPFALDAPVFGAAGANQVSPAIAWTGLRYFVVWEDYRDGQSADLWFAHVDELGRPQGRLNAPLVRAPGQQRSPEVVAGAGELLVAWRDDTLGCASEILAQSFGTDAQPRSAAQRLSAGACTGERPAMAFDPVASRWLVAWGRHGAGRDIHGALLGPGGQVLVPDFVIAAAANDAQTPAVTALDGGGFAVAWADERVTWGQPNIFVATVSATGAVGAAQAIAPFAGSQTAPAITAQGSGAFVAWFETTGLKGLALSPALAPVGAPSTLVALGTGLAALAPLPGGEVLVAYQENRNGGLNVFARAVSDAGVASAELLALPRVGYFSRARPRLATGTLGALIVAEGDGTYVSGVDVHARAVATEPTALHDAGVALVSWSATPASRVRGAFDGTSYLAAWRDDGVDGAGSDGVGQLVQPGTGAWLGPDAGLRLTSSSANLASDYLPAAMPGGFFFTWGDHGSAALLMGRTVSSSGALGPAQRLSDTSTSVYVFRTAWHGDALLTVFLKSATLRVRRTSAAGATLSPETVLVATGTAREQLGAASAGDALLVAYLSADGGATDVSAVRLDVDGGLLDATPLLVSAWPGDELDPAVGAGPSNALIAWAWSPDGGAGAREVYAARVSRGGALLDVPPLRLGPGHQPAVGWLGSSYLVAWTGADDVVAARVSEAGLVLDATPFALAAGPGVERQPWLAAGPPGEVLATWEAFEPSLGVAAFRARGRFVWDSSLVDAGVDAGVLPDGGAGDDAGATSDAGTPDAGPSGDGGATVDAGVEVDAGTPPDAGTSTDAGASSDAGSASDGGPGEPRHYGVGCSGCAAAPAGQLVGVAVLAALRRRRRGP